jgi:hypothetical protein
MMSQPYNPLDKLNLARSIEAELLKREPVRFSDLKGMQGAGVYALYYCGDFAPYAQIAERNSGGNFTLPIYVGKAIPEGGRRGGISADASVGNALSKRLASHARSIDQVENLVAKDFVIRLLVVDDIWIPLGENMLIESFKPLWNRAIDGFGNNAPGKNRETQFLSPWDVLHPGRKAFKKAKDSGLTREFLLERIDDHFAGRPMKSLPRPVEEQLEAAKLDVADRPEIA